MYIMSGAEAGSEKKPEKKKVENSQKMRYVTTPEMHQTGHNQWKQ